MATTGDEDVRTERRHGRLTLRRASAPASPSQRDLRLHVKPSYDASFTAASAATASSSK